MNTTDSTCQEICSGQTTACENAIELNAQDGTSRSLIYKGYWHALELAISELGWTPMSILDVGCGDGTLMSWIARSNQWAKLHAVDFSKDMIALAQTKHGCRVQYKAISQEYNLPYPDQSMDLVLSHAILPSHYHPHRLITEMARVSKEAIIFSTLHPFFFQLVRWLPLSKFWHLNQREKAFYIQPEQITQDLIGDQAIRYALEVNGFDVELVSSPFPFRLYLARHPQRKKTTFLPASKPIKTEKSLSSSLK